MDMSKTLLNTALFFVATQLCVQATVIYPIGDSSFWGTVSWTAINGLNDPDDGLAEQLDFVGDATTPGAYWGIDDSYVYFRMRLDVGLNPSFSDSHFVLFDVEGNINPDYAFAWDSNSNDPDKHGLEMLILDTTDGTWGGTKMDDIDGSSGQKGVLDINGNSRTTDGYVRAEDDIGSDTDFFGKTTFLDFAVSLSYLSNNVPAMVTNSNWNVQFATIANANDHGFLSADIAGGQTPGSTITSSSWSTIAIPEPTAATLIIGFGASLLVIRRIFEK